MSLENYFEKFKKNIVGSEQTFDSPYGKQRIIYADWTASGRMYGPIEDRFRSDILPFVANTHTETSVTGTAMTFAYHEALEIIKNHVHANPEDIIISSNSGMTGVVNKFQRILGLKVHERFSDYVSLPAEARPIVFITHMEHHSNQTTWLETIADVEIIGHNEEGLVDLDSLRTLLEKYKNRFTKIAAVTSCSNVTGVFTPYHEIAEIMHEHSGLCFVDFACSAPYIDINMHPENKKQDLDAIYFSPHKFLGGPGSAGVLIFNKKLYRNQVPDEPGGGTVDWTNPWGEHKYIDDINAREDGGTPAFLQTIRTALSIKLKDEMEVEKILKREHELLNIIFPRLEKIENLHVLAGNVKDRLGVISFYINGLHYNLGVKLLNDRFGIQVRGGCSCAGTYGHILLGVTQDLSHSITSEISCGILSSKPGWIRMSIHPTMSNGDVDYILNAIEELASNFKLWSEDYEYDLKSNEFLFKDANSRDQFKSNVCGWLNKSLTE